MADNQTKYVDGFVLIVPKDKVNEYIEIAKSACKMWMDAGALESTTTTKGGGMTPA